MNGIKTILKRIPYVRKIYWGVRHFINWILISNPLITWIRVRMTLNRFNEQDGFEEECKFEEDSIFRQIYINERNRQLVEYSKKKDSIKIDEWFGVNHVEKKYSDSYFKNRISARVIYGHIVNTFHSSNILDAACGYGEIDVALSKKGFNVYGCDLSEQRVSTLRKSLANVRLCDVMDYPEERKFDIIIALEMFEHVVDIEATIEKIRNLLKLGGHAMFQLLIAI